MKKVLVTTDLSANSKAGIRFAIQLSKQTNCKLVFYHLVEVMKPTSWNDDRFKKFAASKVADAEMKLRDFVQALFTGSGQVMGNHEFKAELGTRVVEKTIDQAKKVRADFICMSTRGGGKLKKLLGTNASEMLTTSPRPVIVVPERYRMQPVKTLFYSTDMEALSKELNKVKSLAADLKAKVEVFYYDYLLMEPENVRKMEKRVQRFLEPGLSFNFKKLSVEEPLAAHIKRDVKKSKPSMLVLFTKQNRNWFDRLFLPSKSAELSLEPTVPMLVFRKSERT